MVTLWGVPGVRVRVDGFALTPEGNPASETTTGCAKLSDGLATTLTDWGVASGVNVKPDGETAREKEPVVSFCVVWVPMELPPQPAITNTRQKKNGRKLSFQKNLT
jgi:hypothetical protein